MSFNREIDMLDKANARLARERDHLRRRCEIQGRLIEAYRKQTMFTDCTDPWRLARVTVKTIEAELAALDNEHAKPKEQT